MTTYSLKDIGINENAYTKEYAIKLIMQLKKKQIPILGGDVYILENTKISRTIDNWYCNRIEQEAPLNYVERSYQIALKYIESYPIQSTKIVLFSLIYETK